MDTKGSADKDRSRGRDRDREKEKDRDRERERDRDRERERDRDRERNKEKDRGRDKPREKPRDRDEERKPPRHIKFDEDGHELSSSADRKAEKSTKPVDPPKSDAKDSPVSAIPPKPAAGPITQMSLQEKRKLIWGAKKEEPKILSNWDGVQLGDEQRTDKFLALMGMKKKSAAETASAEPKATPPGPVLKHAMSTDEQQRLFKEQEQVYESYVNRSSKGIGFRS